MKQPWVILWLLPVVLAAVFWWFPPRGDDAYYHSVNAVEQVRAWHEGAVFPRYHRGWNGGTGSFAPTIYAPIPLAIQGGLAWLVGDGQRAVGLSLVCALAATAGFLVWATGRPNSVVLLVTPYFLAVVLTRATTTEAWALAGATIVLALGMPCGDTNTRKGLGLAAGIVLVAGSQLGMLVQLSWLLAAAWLTWFFIARNRPELPVLPGAAACLHKLAWATTGFLTAAIFWMPTLLDGRNLALEELFTGPFDWRRNFLPGNTELSLFLALTGVCLCVVIFVVLLRGKGDERIPPVLAAAVGLCLSVGLSAPVWSMPGMKILQFPWRFLGPATVLVVMAIESLGGRWKWVAVVVLLVPGAALPFGLDHAGGNVPVNLSPVELARTAHDHWGLAPVLPSARGLYAPEFNRIASLQELGSQQPVVTTEARDAFGGSWNVDSAADSVVLLPVQWWPEWRITSDGVTVPFANHHGLVAIDIPAGTAAVRAVLGSSRSRSRATWVSCFGLLVLGGMWWSERRRS